MIAFDNLSGLRYGRLTLLRYYGKDTTGHALCVFRCDCGNELIARYGNVRYGTTRSCGCYRVEKSRERFHFKPARI